MVLKVSEKVSQSRLEIGPAPKERTYPVASDVVELKLPRIGIVPS